MKKQLLTLIAILLPLAAMADVVEIDGIYYNLITKAKEAEVRSNPNKYSGSVKIPSKVTYDGVDYSVTSIFDGAFSGCQELTSVSIPESVTDMGGYVFSGCTGLTSVSLPESLSTIAYHTFDSCTGLKSITLPQSVTLLSSEAFANCTGLTSIVLGDSLKTIGESVFINCSSLATITIPASVTKIDYYAFKGCSSLSMVNIANLTAWCGIKFGWESDRQHQGDYTSNPLYTAQHLSLNGVEITELELPEGLYQINSIAFVNWTSLTSVTFSDTHEVRIKSYAFNGCTGLTSVKISDLSAWCSLRFATRGSNPLYFAKRLYLNGTEIKDLVIPHGVGSVEKFTFTGMSNLTSVTLPSSVMDVGESAFEGCSALASLSMSEGLNSINSSAFRNCSSLYSLSIPNSVTWMDQLAFAGCTGLKSLRLPEHLKTLSSNIFWDCKSLTSVTIPDEVSSIKEGAFCACSSLVTLTLGTSMWQIENRAFASCPELADVYCKAEYVPSAADRTFEGSLIEYATLHVPAASVEAYKAKYPWNKFKSIVALDGDTPVDPEPPVTPKCATPVIRYQNGQLSFDCDTEGVEFTTSIYVPDNGIYYGETIPLTVTYSISVWASKPGYDNSDQATATLCWLDTDPESEGISIGLAQVPATPVLIRTEGNLITIEGAPDRASIAVFTPDGRLAGSTISQNGSASIATHLPSGTTIIVRIGDKSIKLIK